MLLPFFSSSPLQQEKVYHPPPPGKGKNAAPAPAPPNTETTTTKSSVKGGAADEALDITHGQS
jgi:hypothetical protein